MEVWEDMTPKNELWERIKKLKADNNQLQAESEKLRKTLMKIKRMLDNGDIHNNPRLYTPDKIKSMIEQSLKGE